MRTLHKQHHFWPAVHLSVDVAQDVAVCFWCGPRRILKYIKSARSRHKSRRSPRWRHVADGAGAGGKSARAWCLPLLLAVRVERACRCRLLSRHCLSADLWLLCLSPLACCVDGRWKGWRYRCAVPFCSRLFILLLVAVISRAVTALKEDICACL